MTDLSRFELLSLAISLLAAAISAVALIRTHQTAKRQLELQKRQADLANFQHKLLVREEQARARADLRAIFIRQGKGHFKFNLKNLGASSARNIRLAGSDGTPEPEPFLASELSNTFPVAELRPGEEVWLIAAIHLSTRLPVPIVLTWDDDASTNQQREIKVQIAA